VLFDFSAIWHFNGAAMIRALFLNTLVLYPISAPGLLLTPFLFEGRHSPSSDMRQNYERRCASPSLIESELTQLPVWPLDGVTTTEFWEKYRSVAIRIQKLSCGDVAKIISIYRATSSDEFLDEADSRLFLLFRVIFDLPQDVPCSERMSFKGWINWPRPDARGCVSISWPINWEKGRPSLIDGYMGSFGLQYDAESEYRYLHEHYLFRKLNDGG
jgi:hypothetical protein